MKLPLHLQDWASGREMYSQKDEEREILNFFGGKIGRFLDLGAHDGVRHSNTYRLVTLGWSGVCVEPSVGPLTELIPVHRANPKITILTAAITEETDGLIEFYDSNDDQVSTLDPAFCTRWETTDYRKTVVPAVSVNTLFKHLGYNFDLISLDVEGMSTKILKKLPLDKLSTKLLVVEMDDPVETLNNIVSPHGYTLLKTTSENALFGRVSHLFAIRQS